MRIFKYQVVFDKRSSTFGMLLLICLEGDFFCVYAVCPSAFDLWKQVNTLKLVSPKAKMTVSSSLRRRSMQIKLLRSNCHLE